jgi:hypothetical protein
MRTSCSAHCFWICAQSAVTFDQIVHARGFAKRPALGQRVSPGVDLTADFLGPLARR